MRPRLLVVQFGGAAGTLASLGDKGLQVRQELARELGLAVPVMPWHTQRDNLCEAAGWLSLVTGSLAKMAQDTILMAQSEVAELRESDDAARGGSSTMPQKSNPVQSEWIVAAARTNAGVCARQAGDLVSAERYFREALTINNTSPEALTALMEMAYEDANFLRARAFMQRYLDSQAAHPSVLWMCVQIENQLNNPAEADSCAARLTELFPSSPEAARLQQLSDARIR